MARHPITNWTVDYGDGPQEVVLPHAWRQDVDVRWEGPAIYETEVDVPKDGETLLFQGVSYAARVFVRGSLSGVHKGIWDAFAVPLVAHRGERVTVRVEVTKNGGPSFPVRDVLSGFLPYVYHTFGGIFRPVELCTSSVPNLTPPAPPARVSVDGTKIFVDDRPFYARGVLTWGWYPELGHCHPPQHLIVDEIKKAKALGFNVIKFCLWMPPHEYLELMESQGMLAWLELPLWDPSSDPSRQAEFGQEIERIVLQYRRHPNVLCWTIGCELSQSTPPEFRQSLVNKVKAHTGSPLVKDNSGGAEMYGGDPREFGDFEDFHPYCDTVFYPGVLDSLLLGPRTARPILLGEFNDVDVHRDAARTVQDQPYWISENPYFNDVGVRWQHDFPTALPVSRFANPEDRAPGERLMNSTVHKAEFIRKTVQEAVRSRSDISGYVITGWVDTPISTTGFLDERGNNRYSTNEIKKWNGPACLFLIPSRQPPWVHGGNRPGWVDPQNFFVGPILWRVGAHTERPLHGRLEWDILRFSWDEGLNRGRVAQGACDPVDVPELTSSEVGQIFWEAKDPGGYLLRVSFAGQTNTWPIWVVAGHDKSEFKELGVDDPGGFLADLGMDAGSDISTRLRAEPARIQFLLDEATVPMPFWREAAYEFQEEFWNALHMNECWERLLPVTPDRVISSEWLAGTKHEVLLRRIDVRTYAEHAVLVRLATGPLVTTLRPFGGLGHSPFGVTRNPSGLHLLRGLLAGSQ